MPPTISCWSVVCAGCVGSCCCIAAIISVSIGSSWLYVVPWGLRKLLNFIAKNYGDPEIIITENGSSTKHPNNEPGDLKQLNDVQRCRYITAYLNEALKGKYLQIFGE